MNETTIIMNNSVATANWFARLWCVAIDTTFDPSTRHKGNTFKALSLLHYTVFAIENIQIDDSVNFVQSTWTWNGQRSFLSSLARIETLCRWRRANGDTVCARLPATAPSSIAHFVTWINIPFNWCVCVCASVIVCAQRPFRKIRWPIKIISWTERRREWPHKFRDETML